MFRDLPLLFLVLVLVWNHWAAATAHNSGSSSSSTKAIDTNSVLPAYEGGSDLESFLVAGQRALLNNDGDKNIIPLETKVCIASTLKEFYSGQPVVSIDETDGTIRATVHAFVEPLWENVHHSPNPEVSMAFVRDEIVRRNINNESSDNPTASASEVANTLLERLEKSPTVALKMIRREAIEELWLDYQKQKNVVHGEHESDNEQEQSFGSSSSNDEDDKIARAKSGDADAACRINKLAVEWALRDEQQSRSQTGGTEVTNDDCAIELVCEDDRVLATSDASLQYVQSRISYGEDNDHKSNNVVRFCVQSPSLATPYRYERERGTGCTYCKVVAPRTIANALAGYRYKLVG